MKCSYCEWHCDLTSGSGICGRYHAENGRVTEKQPFMWIGTYDYSVESMPFYHVSPNMFVIQTGSAGCTARCDYCINSHLAIDEDPERKLKYYEPEQLIRIARQSNAEGFVFALNEITVFLPSAIAVAEEAHRQGMKVGCLTNGFQTEESAELLAEHMDFINVSLKSFSDEFYRRNLKLSSVQPVLRNIRTYAERSHLEVVTPLVREILGEDVERIRGFLAEVSTDIVWHLFRLMPRYERSEESDLQLDVMVKLWEESRKIMPYTYLGNFSGSRWVDTYCPDCGKLLIKRIATGAWSTRTLQNKLVDSKCPDCGRKIPMVL